LAASPEPGVLIYRILETLVAKYPGSEAAEKAKSRLIGKK
jgi:TolA-binding protein